MRFSFFDGSHRHDEPDGKLVFHIFSALTEFGRSIIRTVLLEVLDLPNESVARRGRKEMGGGELDPLSIAGKTAGAVHCHLPQVRFSRIRVEPSCHRP